MLNIEEFIAYIEKCKTNIEKLILYIEELMPYIAQMYIYCINNADCFEWVVIFMIVHRIPLSTNDILIVTIVSYNLNEIAQLV